MDANAINSLLAKFPCTPVGDAVITCPARLSWPSLDQPTAPMDKSKADDKRYRVTLLFPLGADLAVMKEAAQKTAAAKWGDKLGEVARSKNFKSPFIPQDEKAEKYDGYTKGAYFINATTKRKPALIDGTMSAIDPSEVYAGCWVRVKLTVRAYDQDGGRGVIFDLVSIQKIADDEAFGSGTTVDPQEGFGPAVTNGTGAAPAAASKPASALF